VSQVLLVGTPVLVCLVAGVTLNVVALVCNRRQLTARRQKDVQLSSTSSSSKALSVRVSVASVVGAGLLAVFTVTVIYDVATHHATADAHIDSASTSVTATVVRITCPLLMSVVTVPCMMMSGQATATWRTLTSRRRCAEVASRSAAVTAVTSSQPVLGDVVNTAQRLRVTPPQYHQRHDIHDYQCHPCQQQSCHQQQQLMRQYITCHDFCTASHAHHQQRHLYKQRHT